MLEGIRRNAEAMNALTQKHDVLANNLANANSTGFKKDAVRMGLFQSELNRQSASLEAETRLDKRAGSLHQTNNPLDMAIAGDGFFAVNTPAGVRYTRNGSFVQRTTGELVTQTGLSVLGESGPITLDPAKGPVTVAGDGRISQGSTVVGKLKVAHFPSNAALEKAGEGLYTLTRGAEGEGRSEVVQGSLELSNVNTVEEMVDILGTLRLFEANQKAIRVQDESLGKAVNILGL